MTTKKKKNLRQVLLRQRAQQNGLCAAQGQQNTVVHGTFTSEQRADRIREAERPLPISRRVNGSAAPVRSADYPVSRGNFAPAKKRLLLETFMHFNEKNKRQAR